MDETIDFLFQNIKLNIDFFIAPLSKMTQRWKCTMFSKKKSFIKCELYFLHQGYRFQSCCSFCLHMFDPSSSSRHTNSGKSEKSIIFVRTPPTWMVSSKGSGVWASFPAGLRMITTEMDYAITPFCRCESHGFGDMVLVFWVQALENTV